MLKETDDKHKREKGKCQMDADNGIQQQVYKGNSRFWRTLRQPEMKTR